MCTSLKEREEERAESSGNTPPPRLTEQSLAGEPSHAGERGQADGALHGPMPQWGCSHPSFSNTTADEWPPDTDSGLFMLLKLNESAEWSAGEEECWLPWSWSWWFEGYKVSVTQNGLTESCGKAS